MAGSDGSFSILIAARDERGRIKPLVERLRTSFPEATIIVADDGSRDGTGEEARAVGALVVACPRLGKGEALNAAERAAPEGPLLLCDADVEGDLGPLTQAGHDLTIGVFAERVGGGLGMAKGAGRSLIRLRCGFHAREPLSGQRFLSPRARAAAFPLARGFGCEIRMTIDVRRAGLSVGEVDLPLRHRATGRDLAGFVHRGRQLVDLVPAAGPLAVNYRGNRLPLVGLAAALAGRNVPLRVRAAVTAIALTGLADDLWGGPERGLGGHLRAGRTTGTLKLVLIPAAGLLATSSVGGGLVVGLAANAINQLDTRPGRALKSFLLAALLVRGRTPARYARVAVLLLPYDLRERVMLGDAGSNALGAVLGFALVARVGTRGRWTAVVLLAALNALGDQVSLGRIIERTPVLSHLDAAGRIRPLVAEAMNAW